MITKEIQDRFEAKFKSSSDGSCWEWLANKSDKGYGWFRVKSKMDRAHRVSYKVYKGDIPDGLHVLHTCDNPSCVNPEHLFLGTNIDNVADKVKKGRAKGSPGESNPKAKLTLVEVSIIRDAIKEGFSQRRIGKYFNISDSTVGAINTGQNWAK